MESVIFVLFSYRGNLARQETFPGSPDGLRDMANSLERCVEAGMTAAIEKIVVNYSPKTPEQELREAPYFTGDAPWTMPVEASAEPDASPETVPTFGNPGPDQPLPFHPSHRSA